MMLSRFLSRNSRTKGPSAPQGSRAYAIGDVHGRLDLLTDLLAKIEADNELLPPAKVYLVFLGDLVDRGPDSHGVIEHLLLHPPQFGRSVMIKGNHEEFFLSVLEGDAKMVVPWLSYGGYECAESYGVTKGWVLNATPESVIERLTRQVPQTHQSFLKDMADTFRFGDYLFVHAGIRPGVDLCDQSSKDLRWIRDGFLEDRSDHGVIVVHGHTIVDRPEQHPNRIAVDTGAYKSGVLTAIAIEGTKRWFIEARAEAAVAA